MGPSRWHKRPLLPHPTDPNARLVVLASGRGHAVIDAQDASVVGEYNWCASSPTPSQKCHYASARAGASCAMIRLHQLIAQLAGFDPEAVIDFKDGDSLNCRRANLRCPPTRSQHCANRAGVENAAVPYKGVYKARKKFVAQIGRTKLGRFDDPVTAALAVDRAAKAKFGEFAWLNFPAPAVAAA